MINSPPFYVKIDKVLRQEGVSDESNEIQNTCLSEYIILMSCIYTLK